MGMAHRLFEINFFIGYKLLIFSVLNHGYKRLKSERRTHDPSIIAFSSSLLRTISYRSPCLLIVYYELQSISFADRIYRPVIDQLIYYCVRGTRFVLGVLCIIGCPVQLTRDVFLRWPVPIYMRVGYVFDSSFSE